MSKGRVGVSNFSHYTAELIRKYGDTVYDALEESINEVAKEAASKLKNDQMPFDTKTGGYQKDWTWQKVKSRLFVNAIVYNKKHYQLSHLLEYGHAKQNGGRTRAFEHIAPVDAWARTEIIDRMLDKLSS